MKKLTLTLSVGLISAVLLTIVPMQGMENHVQLAAQAEKYNADKCLLFKLSNDMLFEVFLHRLSDDELSISSLQNDIKYLIPLSAICKHFTRLVTPEKIGDLYKKDLNINEVLQKIISQLYYSNKNKTLSVLVQVLVYAGANVNIKCNNVSALEFAIRLNEEKLVATLLKYNANPNIESIYDYPFKPVFFLATTTNIARMLMDTGKVNIHATDCDEYKNVLHYMLQQRYSPELIEFYLKHNVNAKKLSNLNYCILHNLAQAPFYGYESDIEKILEKGKILLSAIPHMVNTLTKEGKTPIDLAREGYYSALKSLKLNNFSNSPIPKEERIELLSTKFTKIITLFRDHGGLNAETLQKQIR